MGDLPEYYFQAIGSGTGAIAVYETATRLIRENQKIPRLFLSQNAPYDSIYQAWRSKTRNLVAVEEENCREKEDLMWASILANRNPPYALAGGLFEALTDSGGEIFAVDNEEAMRAANLFQELEGIDLEPASAVAFASLLQATRLNLIPKYASILLNVTGAGYSALHEKATTRLDAPHLLLTRQQITEPYILGTISALFRR
jgi:cysteate synthase